MVREGLTMARSKSVQVTIKAVASEAAAPVVPVKAPGKPSDEWMARRTDTPRPEVAASYLNGASPNTPLEGPALAPFLPPYRSANEYNPTLQGPALGPYRPPVRS